LQNYSKPLLSNLSKILEFSKVSSMQRKRFPFSSAASSLQHLRRTLVINDLKDINTIIVLEPSAERRTSDLQNDIQRLQQSLLWGIR